MNPDEAPQQDDPTPAPVTTLHFDPEVAAEKKLRRQIWLHTVHIPRLRIVGNAMLALAVLLHGRFLEPLQPWPDLWRFTLVITLYGLAAWWLMAACYRRFRFDVGLLLLIVDLFFWVQAVYLTGGERSWLLFFLVLRTADQTNTSYRRTLLFAHLTIVGYLLMLTYISAVDERAIFWPTELIKGFFLYGANIYLTLSARNAERRRHKLVQAVRVARELIQQREENTRQLERARARAEAASEAKGRFLANISHEIRTPLNAIVGLAENLSESSLSDDQSRSVELLASSADALLQLIDDVLDFSKIEADKLEIELHDCDLRGLLKSVVHLFRPQADARGLSLGSRLEPLVPRRVRTDPLRLRQILINLVSNALKFTDTGGVEIRVTLAGETPARDRLRFEIEDTGIGFDAGMLDQLFEPFIQADSSSTRKHGGTGLGLPICKRLVALLGGEIGAVSSPGQGTSFWFTVPLLLPQSDEVLAEEPASSNLEPAPGGRRRVLVVEDNEINRLVVLKQLESLGVEVEAVADGRQALSALASGDAYDLILMDCQMPELDGYEATARIRRREGGESHVPIVAMTAHAMAGDREKCLAAGMDDYLSKPIKRKDLTRVLAEWT